MNQPAKSQDQSMEEILASIRKIIAEDDIPKPSPKPAPAPVLNVVAPLRPVEDAPQDVADILDLTEAMSAAAPPVFRSLEAQAEALFAVVEAAQAAVEPVEAPALTAEHPQAGPVEVDPIEIDSLEIASLQETEADHLESARQALAEQMDPPLLSGVASAAVDNAFASLAHTVLARSDGSLDDMVKEMLRPMLKSWLDDNLPSLVERLVRAEIERVSRGR